MLFAVKSVVMFVAETVGVVVIAEKHCVVIDVAEINFFGLDFFSIRKFGFSERT